MIHIYRDGLRKRHRYTSIKFQLERCMKQCILHFTLTGMTRMFFNHYMNNIICSNSFLDASIFDCNRAWSRKKNLFVLLSANMWLSDFFKRMGIAKQLIWIIMSWNQKLNHLYSMLWLLIRQYSRLIIPKDLFDYNSIYLHLWR